MVNKRFRDRADAGAQLAEKLTTYTCQPQAIVLGLPRGGVPVASPIAQTLHLSLDICLVHKLGVPGNPEVAMGAIDLQGRRYLNQRIITELRIAAASIDRVAALELLELQRRDRVYRGDRPELDLRDQTVIIVDDGLATGATMKSAVGLVKLQQPTEIVVAVPVAFPEAVDDFDDVDRFVCLITPDPFYAIGSWYENFAQVTDAEVCAALASSR